MRELTQLGKEHQYGHRVSWRRRKAVRTMKEDECRVVWKKRLV